jgi:hypothetical protein
MAVEASGLEAKAHELLGQLGPGKLAAVVQLLEVMVHDDDDDDQLTPQDRTAIQAGLDSLDRNGGVPMEDVLADFGLTMADFEKLAAAPDSGANR